MKPTIVLYKQYKHSSLGLVTVVAVYEEDALVIAGTLSETEKPPIHHVKTRALEIIISDYQRWELALLEVHRRQSLDNAYDDRTTLVPLGEVAKLIWDGTPPEAHRHLTALHPPITLQEE